MTRIYMHDAICVCIRDKSALVERYVRTNAFVALASSSIDNVDRIALREKMIMQGTYPTFRARARCLG